MKYQKLYQLLNPIHSLNECNGIYERMVNERMQALADIKNCDMADLTLREVIGCVEAVELDYNELLPTLFDGHASRPTSDITRDQLGALA